MDIKCQSSTALLIVLALFSLIVGPVSGSFGAEELTSGTSSRKARQQIVNALPYQQLSQDTLDKLNPVLEKPSIYRRLPITQINVDAEYFIFLARYPEVIVNIWKLMGITNMAATRTGPYTVNSDDGAGTLSDIELVYGTRNLHIFYGTGSYTGPVLKRGLTGAAVVVLQTEFKTGADGQPVAVNQLDVFMKINNATAGMVARTLNPLVGPTADHNFVESLNFIERLNDTTVKNGPGVQQMAGRLTDLTADVRQQYIRVAGETAERANGSPETATPASWQQDASGGYDSSGASRYEASGPSGYDAAYAREQAYPRNQIVAQGRQPVAAPQRQLQQAQPQMQPAYAHQMQPAMQQPTPLQSYDAVQQRTLNHQRAVSPQRAAVQQRGGQPQIMQQPVMQQPVQPMQMQPQQRQTPALQPQRISPPASNSGMVPVRGYPPLRSAQRNDYGQHNGSVRSGVSANAYQAPDYQQGNMYRR